MPTCAPRGFPACLPAWVRACVRLVVRARVSVCVLACVCLCARVRVRACDACACVLHEWGKRETLRERGQERQEGRVEEETPLVERGGVFLDKPDRRYPPRPDLA